MHKPPLLSNEPVTFSLSDLPMLIHGKDHTGASLFTVSVAASLSFHHHKVLFFSAYEHAKEELARQVGEYAPLVLRDPHTISGADRRQLIFVEPGNFHLFLEVIHRLWDIRQRVIVIRNIERFPERVFQAVKPLQHIIVSGNLTEVAYQEKLFSKQFQTNVAFSPAPEAMHLSLPADLPEFQGMLQSSRMTGVVGVRT